MCSQASKGDTLSFSCHSFLWEYQFTQEFVTLLNWGHFRTGSCKAHRYLYPHNLGGIQATLSRTNYPEHVPWSSALSPSFHYNSDSPSHSVSWICPFDSQSHPKPTCSLLSAFQFVFSVLLFIIELILFVLRFCLFAFWPIAFLPRVLSKRKMKSICGFWSLKACRKSTAVLVSLKFFTGRERFCEFFGSGGGDILEKETDLSVCFGALRTLSWSCLWLELFE